MRAQSTLTALSSMGDLGKMLANYLGIDPGLSGGFVVVVGDRIRYKMVMPTITLSTIKMDGEESKKTEIDRKGVLSFLQMLPPHSHVVIEKQEAYRGQNIVATGTTHKNYGILLMALTATHFFITETPPDIWQKHFDIVSVKKAAGNTTKEQALKIAEAKYPYTDFRKSKRSHKPHDGIVDASLIANYCQSLFAPSHALIEPGTKLERRQF